MDVQETVEKSIDESYEESSDEQIKVLLNSVPALKELFHVHYKVGEGAFSTVFLATLKNASKPKNFAVKYLVPTCHPDRIGRELKCLKDIGGQDHVVGLELCFRHAGSVVFVMPFLKHDKFSDYAPDMSAEELKDYMKALLTALRRVHKFNIIHRDIKPNNFLYDRNNRRYLLVDFGLAQQYSAGEKLNSLNKKVLPLESQSVKRKRTDENQLDTTLKTVSTPSGDKCYCFGKPKICSICLIKPPQTAPRAGTPGYRAPEVLLKYPSQTPAIDIWACGIMMLSILTGTILFFRSPDDMTALAEITTIFGSNVMQQCARKLGKKLIFSSEIPGIDLVLLCQKLQKRNISKNESTENTKEESEKKFPEEAYQLLARLLDVDYKTRITAEEALLHPFFK